MSAMWVFPMAAAVVSGVFAALLGQRFFSGRKPHQLAWTIALLMFTGASFAAAMGLIAGWTPLWYRLFFLMGAIVNVPVLALGTIYLLMPKRIGNVMTVIVVAACIFAAGSVFGADLKPEGLAVVGRIPRATLTLPEGTRSVGRIMSYSGFVVVVAGALLSAWRLARGKEERLRRLAMGNILIAVGTTVVAGASALLAFARSLGTALFSIGLLAGVTLMFMGFLKTRPPNGPDAATEAPDTSS